MATIKGKWKWNETLSTAPREDTGGSGAEAVYHVNFKVNGVQYIGLYFWGNTTWNDEINGMNWRSCYYYSTSNEYRARLFADGLDYNISTDADRSVMDFGSEEQYINDTLYEYIISNATEIQPYVDFLYNVKFLRDVTVDKELTVTGSITAERLTVETLTGDLASTQVSHGEDNLSDIINTYILDIDYDALTFDTTEIVVNSNTTSVLGQAILGQMILA